MVDHVYKSVEVTGSSAKSIEEAVEKAVTRTAQSLRKLRWFEVTEIRGQLDDKKIEHWQVTLKIGFTLEDQ